jgi:hypothetical protein
MVRRRPCENAAVSDRYARFYAPLALSLIALAFAPLFEDVRAKGITVTYGTVFAMAARPGGEPAVLGLLLLGGLAVVLVVLAMRGGDGPWLPLTSVGLELLVVLMLVTKPGTGTPAPDLSPFGRMGIALLVCGMLIGVWHLTHRLVLARRP